MAPSKTQETFAVGSRPYLPVALADLTGDAGGLDIVVTDYGGNSLSVLLNQGKGSFAPARTLATNQGPLATLVDDFNGDGLPDLATINNHDGTISVLLGTGNGKFESAPAGSGVGLNDTPLYGDFNGDGIPDTVVLDQSGNITLPSRPGRLDECVRKPHRDPEPRPASALHHRNPDQLSARDRGC